MCISLLITLEESEMSFCLQNIGPVWLYMMRVWKEALELGGWWVFFCCCWWGFFVDFFLFGLLQFFYINQICKQKPNQMKNGSAQLLFTLITSYRRSCRWAPYLAKLTMSTMIQWKCKMTQRQRETNTWLLTCDHHFFRLLFKNQPNSQIPCLLAGPGLFFRHKLLFGFDKQDT